MYRRERSHHLKHIVYLFSDELVAMLQDRYPVYEYVRQKEYLKDSDVHDTIIMTDHQALAEDLLKRGFAVVGVEHSGRRMPGIPYICDDIDLEEAYLEQIFCHMRMIPLPIFSTERLRVREIGPVDVDALYELYRDEETARYLDPLFEDPDAEREYTRNYISNVYAMYGFGMWIIEEAESGRIVGRIGLEQKELPGIMRKYCAENGYFSDKALELGYMLGREFWHRGYAVEAAEGVFRYAATELENPLIYAVTRPVNQASCSLCERLGGQNIGMADEQYRVYVLRE